MVRVTCGIATKGDRPEQLRQTIKSLRKQVDKLYIYDNTKATDLTDQGKFWGAQFEEDYYFTCDDDIIYPPDYVKETIKHLESWPIVTYHGRILKEEKQVYYGAHEEYAFYGTVEKNLILDVAGTGVMAVDLSFITPRISEHRCVSDLTFSLQAREMGLPILMPAHKQGWIKPQPVKSSIFSTHKQDQSLQVELVNKILEL